MTTLKKKEKKEVGITTTRAKLDIGEFDVFLAHNSKDKNEVQLIAEELRQRGINPWLDIEQIPPGRWFQDLIQTAFPNIKSVAIFIGPSGFGKWEIAELRVSLTQCVKRGIPLIPVLLPGVINIPHDLLFLGELHWVQFQSSVNDPKSLEKLVWGITTKDLIIEL